VSISQLRTLSQHFTSFQVQNNIDNIVKSFLLADIAQQPLAPYTYLVSDQLHDEDIHSSRPGRRGRSGLSSSLPVSLNLFARMRTRKPMQVRSAILTIGTALLTTATFAFRPMVPSALVLLATPTSSSAVSMAGVTPPAATTFCLVKLPRATPGLHAGNPLP